MSNLGNITDTEFHTFVAAGVTLVDFWAPWCQPCIQLTPRLEEAASVLGDRVRIVKMDVDANPKVAEELGVMSVPALLLFKDGKRLARSGNLSSVAQILSMVETALA
jgi:thioredoxin 1